MRNICLPLLLAAVVALIANSKAASAQTDNGEKPQWRTLHLQYITPDLLANYLDPVHYPIPTEYQHKVSPYIAAKPYAPHPSDDPYDPRYRHDFPTIGLLPSSVEKPLDLKLKFDNSQKEISIYSTKSTFDITRLIAATCDKPLVKFDIRVQEVAIDPENLQLIQAQTQPIAVTPDIGTTPQFYAVNDAGLHIFADLLSQKKATPLKTPNLSLYRFFSGTIESSTFAKAGLEILSNNTGSASVSPDRPLFFERYFEMNFMGSFMNEDNTISVPVSISSELFLTHHDPSLVQENPYADPNQDRFFVKRFTEYQPRNVYTVVVPNNTTLLLTGFTSTSLGLNDKDQNAALFITIKLAE